MDGMDSSHSKEGFFEGQVKKKGAWSFWGKQRKDELWNIKKNEILRV